MPARLAPVRRALALLLGAAALLPVAASAAPVAQTGPKDLVTFGLGPSDGTKVDGRPYFYYAAAPGAVIQDHVVVLNYSRHPLHLALYATDGFNSPDGANSLLQAGQAPKDLGAWTVVTARTGFVDVPGRKSDLEPPGQVVVPFRVAVPRGALPGDHVAGMVASLRTYARNAQGFVIPLDQRVAAQVFLRVAGPLHPRLRIENLRASYLGTLNPFGTGQVRISYTVHNVGNVRLGASQHVRVSGLFGSWTSPRVRDVPLLVPGGSAHVETTVRGVWPEIWMPGAVHVSALKLLTDVNPPTAPATASRHFWAVPWTLLLVAAAVALYRRVAALRRRSDAAGEGPAGGPAPDDPGGPAPQGGAVAAPPAHDQAPEPAPVPAGPGPVAAAQPLPLVEDEGVAPLIYQELMGLPAVAPPPDRQLGTGWPADVTSTFPTRRPEHEVPRP